MARYTFVSARVEWQQNVPHTNTQEPRIYLFVNVYNFSAQLNYHVWSPLWSFIILIFSNCFFDFSCILCVDTVVLRVFLCFTAVLCTRAADSIVTHCSVSLIVAYAVYGIYTV